MRSGIDPEDIQVENIKLNLTNFVKDMSGRNFI